MPTLDWLNRASAFGTAANVLCSLQKLSSATAVEQLLGCVLRMPYASPRGREALNRAYAHVCEARFSTAASALADRLIKHMGFEALDVASMVVQQSLLPLFDSNQPQAPVEPSQVATDFIASAASPELQATAGIQLVQVDGEQKAVVTGHISAEVEALLVAQHNALEAVELDLLRPEAVQFPGVQVLEQSNTFEIYLKDAHVKLRAGDARQSALDYGSGSIAEDEHLLSDPYEIEKRQVGALLGRAVA